MGLLGEMAQEEGVHRPAEADVHLVDLAVGLGDDHDVQVAHALVERGDMFLVAAEPVQRLRHDHVEAAVHRRLLTPRVALPLLSVPIRMRISNLSAQSCLARGATNSWALCWG